MCFASRKALTWQLDVSCFTFPSLPTHLTTCGRGKLPVLRSNEKSRYWIIEGRSFTTNGTGFALSGVEPHGVLCSILYSFPAESSVSSNCPSRPGGKS
jgi:hypothetical protein